MATAAAASARQRKEDSLDGVGKGSRVWFSAGPRSWQLGTLQSVGGDACSVALDSPLGEGAGGVVHMSARWVCETRAVRVAGAAQDGISVTSEVPASTTARAVAATPTPLAGGSMRTLVHYTPQVGKVFKR